MQSHGWHRHTCWRINRVCIIFHHFPQRCTMSEPPVTQLHALHWISCICVHVLQSSTQEFYLISSSLSRLGLELQTLLPAIQSQMSSALLRSLLMDTPDLLAPAHSFLKVLNEKAAKWVFIRTKMRYWELNVEELSVLTSGGYIKVTIPALWLTQS